VGLRNVGFSSGKNSPKILFLPTIERKIVLSLLSLYFSSRLSNVLNAFSNIFSIGRIF